MCGHVVQAESVTTVLGVLSCIYDERAEDAALLMDLYSRDCKEKGAEDGCVLASMFSASIYVSMTLLGEEGKDRVNALTSWWAEHCHN